MAEKPSVISLRCQIQDNQALLRIIGRDICNKQINYQIVGDYSLQHDLTSFFNILDNLERILPKSWIEVQCGDDRYSANIQASHFLENIVVTISIDSGSLESKIAGEPFVNLSFGWYGKKDSENSKKSALNKVPMRLQLSMCKSQASIIVKELASWPDLGAID